MTYYRSIFRAFLVPILLILPLLLSCTPEEKELRIGLVPSTTPSKLLGEFEGIRKYLETEMAVPVSVVVPENYQTLVSMINSAEVDIALFGAFSYILADSQNKLIPLVVRSRKDMGITYSSIIFTRAGGTIKTIDDLEGKRFAFVNTASTSGFMVPCSLFVSRQLDWESFLGSILFAGSHDKVLAAVLSGEVDAGAMSTSILAGQIESGVLAESDLNILWESDPIPGSPFVARRDLKKGTLDRFIEAMIAVDSKSPGSLTLFSGSVEKFVPIEPGLYDGVRNIVRVLGEDYIISKGID